MLRLFSLWLIYVSLGNCHFVALNYVIFWVVWHCMSCFIYFYAHRWLMNRITTRSWKVLCWNVRGLNSDKRQRSVREKVIESQCSVVCLQETKLSSCSRATMKSNYTHGFDQFVESPSRGASGGLLTAWRSDVFHGTLLQAKPYAIVMQFTSVHNNEQWFLVNVYGPCQGELRDEFVSWIYNLDIDPGQLWMLMGDFNFIRCTDNRNLPGGDINDMFIFNEIIGHLGLLELPLMGRRFTWYNM